MLHAASRALSTAETGGDAEADGADGEPEAATSFEAFCVAALVARYQEPLRAVGVRLDALFRRCDHIGVPTYAALLEMTRLPSTGRRPRRRRRRRAATVRHVARRDIWEPRSSRPSASRSGRTSRRRGRRRGRASSSSTFTDFDPDDDDDGSDSDATPPFGDYFEDESADRVRRRLDAPGGADLAREADREPLLPGSSGATAIASVAISAVAMNAARQLPSAPRFIAEAVRADARGSLSGKRTLRAALSHAFAALHAARAATRDHWGRSSVQTPSARAVRLRARRSRPCSARGPSRRRAAARGSRAASASGPPGRRLRPPLATLDEYAPGGLAAGVAPHHRDETARVKARARLYSADGALPQQSALVFELLRLSHVALSAAPRDGGGGRQRRLDALLEQRARRLRRAPRGAPAELAGRAAEDARPAPEDGARGAMPFCGETGDDDGDDDRESVGWVLATASPESDSDADDSLLATAAEPDGDGDAAARDGDAPPSRLPARPRAAAVRALGQPAARAPPRRAEAAEASAGSGAPGSAATAGDDERRRDRRHVARIGARSATAGFDAAAEAGSRACARRDAALAKQGAAAARCAERVRPPCRDGDYRRDCHLAAAARDVRRRRRLARAPGVDARRGLGALRRGRRRADDRRRALRARAPRAAAPPRGDGPPRRAGRRRLAPAPRVASHEGAAYRRREAQGDGFGAKGFDDDDALDRPLADQCVAAYAVRVVTPRGPSKGARRAASLYFAAGARRELKKGENAPERWRLDGLTAVRGRRYLLRPLALEFFFATRREVFVAREPPGPPRCWRLMKLKARMPSWPTRRGHDHARAPPSSTRSGSRRWRRRLVTNFEYAMALNTIAGRSYNDLAQYFSEDRVADADPPSDDDDDVRLDANDSDDDDDGGEPAPRGRDGRCAIARRDAAAAAVRRHGRDDDDAARFMYGSHYSSAGVVLHFLVRLEPFTSLALELQGGHFDCPDRLFFDVAESWRGCTTSMSDVKELVPEFFYCPELFVNDNRYPLGELQDGRASEAVSAALPRWIDLVFGVGAKRGTHAETHHNVFHPLTYEGGVDLTQIADATLREAAEAQITHFGQTPPPLFDAPHPPRSLKGQPEGGRGARCRAAAAAAPPRSPPPPPKPAPAPVYRSGAMGAVVAVMASGKNRVVCVHADLTAPRSRDRSLTPQVAAFYFAGARRLRAAVQPPPRVPEAAAVLPAVPRAAPRRRGARRRRRWRQSATASRRRRAAGRAWHGRAQYCLCLATPGNLSGLSLTAEPSPQQAYVKRKGNVALQAPHHGGVTVGVVGCSGAGDLTRVVSAGYFDGAIRCHGVLDGLEAQGAAARRRGTRHCGATVVAAAECGRVVVSGHADGTATVWVDDFGDMAAALASDDVLVAAGGRQAPRRARRAGAVVEGARSTAKRGASRRRGRAAPPGAAAAQAPATTSAAARWRAPPAAPPRAAAAESSDDDDDREDAYAYGGDAAGAAGEAATPEDEDYDEALFGAPRGRRRGSPVERRPDLVAAAYPDGTIALHTARRGRFVRRLGALATTAAASRGRGRAGRGPAPDAAGHAVALSLAGYVVSASARPCAFDERSPSTIRVFSPNDARPLATRDEPRRVSALALSRSGEFCVFGGDAPHLTVCRVHDLHVCREIRAFDEAPVTCLTFSEDHTHLFVAQEDGCIQVVSRAFDGEGG
ncbi:hypothetical protein JL721_3528 [Aureococcus anophagefferens]|nr:hypothetical protein JL721_3528 [Aureococcus anophagefferens]